MSSEHPADPRPWASRAAALIAGVALAIGAAAWFHPDVDGSDLWWHLAAGREIQRTHAVPTTDPFSHTAGGRDWINHEWLWDVLFWNAYRLGPDLVAWLNASLLVAAFTLAGLAARRAGRSWLAAGLATWIAAAVSHGFLDVRPHVVTLLLVAVLMAGFGGRRAPWSWPPLLALWANLHAGFVFGLGLIGLYVSLRSLSWLRRRSSGFPRAEWIGLACAVLATGLNPWGFELLRLPFETLDPSTPFGELVEWAPPDPDLDPRGYAGRFAWMLGLALAGMACAPRRPFPIAAALVTATMACAARRFIPLFALTALPLVALAIDTALAVARRRLGGVPVRYAPLASLAGLIAALIPWYTVRFLPRPLERWTQEESYPAGAVAYLRALPQPPERLFNSYHWGGYVALHAPGIPVFIDGRAGTVYPDWIATDYLTAIEARPGFRRVLQRHAVDAILVPRSSPLARALARERRHWIAVFRDPRSVLLLGAQRVDGPPPAVDRALSETVDGWLALGLRARAQGDLDSAESFQRAVLRRDPLQIHAYAELMRIAAQRGDAEGVRRWTDVALEAYPRRRRQILDAAGTAWELLGDDTARLAALRGILSASGGPFVAPDELAAVRDAIRELEASVDESIGGSLRETPP